MGPKLEDFEVLNIIGRGSHGIVKKVKRKSDGQILVWKELHYASMNEAEKKGLVYEVNLLRELHHPNIVRFFNHLVDRKTGTLFIFMEYCSGGDLYHLIKKCCKTGSFLEEGFIWKVLKQVCEALKACHEKQCDGEMIVLHRDIKPANVFLDQDGNIKVGDFGLARTLNSTASFATTFVGTPYYMSPEVIDGREYNERSDIWSLGCLMYELCALEPPFKASNQTELKSKIKTSKYKRIPIHYSSGLWEIIQEMLNQNEFLRPSAFMLLHHPSLVANTSQEDVVEEELSDSIALLLNKHKKKHNETQSCAEPTSTVETSDEGESSYTNSFETTVKENVLSDELKRMEESLMREVESLMMESKLRKEKERQERLRGNPLDLSLLESPVDKNVASTSFTMKVSEYEDNSYPEMSSLRQNIASPPKCVCGGTSLDEWRERVSAVRAAEEAVRQREMALEEREREIAKRERRLHSMEQEAKQHLVRAQIYLKQIKFRAQNVPLPPKLNHAQEMSDFDATTVSADPGYDQTPTVAFLDTQPQNNPFLKMRQNLNRKELHYANTNLTRSNTLDNPKSRRKHGIYYYLERSGTEKTQDNAEKIKLNSQINYQTHEKELFDQNKETKLAKASRNSHDCEQQQQQQQQLSNKKLSKPCLNGSSKVTQKKNKDVTSFAQKKNASKCKYNLKENSGNILETLRQNFLRNNATRKSAKFAKECKENSAVVKQKPAPKIAEIQRKPLQVINGKKCQSKGVCALPEKSNIQDRNTKASSFLYFKKNQQNANSEEHFFRFYNAV